MMPRSGSCGNIPTGEEGILYGLGSGGEGMKGGQGREWGEGNGDGGRGGGSGAASPAENVVS